MKGREGSRQVKVNAIAAPASASSASPDKERHNDMSLTYSEWKNPVIPMNQPMADSQLYFGPLNDLNPGRRAGTSAIAPPPDSASSASADMLLT